MHFELGFLKDICSNQSLCPASNSQRPASMDGLCTLYLHILGMHREISPGFLPWVFLKPQKLTLLTRKHISRVPLIQWWCELMDEVDKCPSPCFSLRQLAGTLTWFLIRFTAGLSSCPDLAAQQSFFIGFSSFSVSLFATHSVLYPRTISQIKLLHPSLCLMPCFQRSPN